MRITYVTHTRFPTEKAHGFQVASVCQALARLGHTVTLLTPTVGNVIHEDPLAYYGMKSSVFSIVRLPNFNALRSRWVPGKLAFLVTMRSFRRTLSAFIPSNHADLFYARSPQVLPPLLRAGIPVILELHTLPRMARRMFLARCRRCAVVICLTQTMRDVLLSWGLDAEHVLVRGDAVDLMRFTNIPQREKAKARWLLPYDRPIIGYVGSLVTGDALEKGVREFIDALALLREQRRAIFGWIVGGPNTWRERYIQEVRERGLTENDVRLEGIIPFSAVPGALCSCDVLVYPAPASRHPYFLRDTSPLKLFEYMAAGRPIVCADLPPLRDSVDESIVRFCIPG
ncbi:glycosyltransferase, partial [Candidatus Peregrinibacteria bacterium]|nr:glycosyltransferase [Candidatus Peregrinibacteria bacterium]